MSKLEDKIKGVLCIFFETGYEGSPWAFNDPKFNYPNPGQYVCKKCCRAWNKEKDPKGVEEIEGDYCKPKEHDFELTPEIFWSYEGLHILRTGDYLKIFDKEKSDEILWEGKVEINGVLRKAQYTMEGERREIEVMTYEPEIVDIVNWMKWFDEQYLGELTKKSHEE